MASHKQRQLSRILDISGPGTYNEETGRWSSRGKPMPFTAHERFKLDQMEEDIKHDEELRLFIGRAFVKRALLTHQMTEAEFDVAANDSLDPKMDPRFSTAASASQIASKKKMRKFLISQGVKFIPSPLNPSRIKLAEEEDTSNSGWSFFGFKSKTVEDAEEHLRKWANAILKRDAKAAQAEQKWFNDNDWTALEMKGSPPFYSRMVWKSSKLKKKIGITIANGIANLDPPTNI